MLGGTHLRPSTPLILSVLVVTCVAAPGEQTVAEPGHQPAPADPGPLEACASERPAQPLRHDKDANAQAATTEPWDSVAMAKELARDLHDPNPSSRVWAAVMLGDTLRILSPLCIPGFGAQKDPQELAHLRAIEAELRRDPDPVVRGLAALAHTHAFPGDPNLPEIKAALPVVLEAIRQKSEHHVPAQSEPAWKSRFFFVAVLGDIGPDAAPAVPVVLKILAEAERAPTGLAGQGNKEADRANAVLAALTGIGEPAVPHLKRAVRSRNPAVRTTAAMALAHIDPTVEASLPVLLDSLRGRCWGYCRGATFHRADAGALAALGHRAVPKLLEMVRSGEAARMRPERRESDPVEDIHLALGTMGRDSPAVVPLLIKALEDPHEGVRRIAAEALANYDHQAEIVLPALQKASKDPSPRVREAADQSIRCIRISIDPKGVLPQPSAKPVGEPQTRDRH